MKLVKFGIVLMLPALFVLTGCSKKAPVPATDSTKVEAPAVETPAVDTTANADTAKVEKADTTAKKEKK